MNKEMIKLPEELFDHTPLEPIKVFDNLYCIGTRSVAVWVIKTSEGIILIDSMWSNGDAQLIINDMKKLNLNPHEIKYIIITHGHRDHYGGAQFIKDNYKAKIIMSETDYNFMNASNSRENRYKSPSCSVDIIIKDGEKIQLGHTTVTIVETPGHTPGCVSLIFPVKQHGKIYNVAQWGGLGIPNNLEEKIKYRKSIDYFEKHTQEQKVSVEITAHLFCENGYSKLESVRNNKANPFIIGEIGMKSYFNNLRKEVDYSISKQMVEE
ncbi:MBL fold metallo-hydrolase [Clostridium niameyense]|uniref:MBL fold metallo-hydrolase n=1 Tax=Clostridium niameyense TaxID=1622073 RepID=UPI00067E8DCF|nr:MBL fold metallo-hydrolase [Clostridium niameyense]